MRTGEVITAEVVRVEHNFVVVNAGLKSRSLRSRSKNSRTTRASSKSSPATSSRSRSTPIENGYGDTILSRDKAKRLASWLSLENSLESGEFVTGTVNGKVKGGLTVLVNGIRAFLPGLAARHASGQGHEPVRGQDDGVQGHQARPQAQQRRVVAPRRGRGLDGRRARQAAGDAARRRDRPRRGQEHHRVRRVRRPRRHRRPAAHHRHGLAPCPPPERSGAGRPGARRQGAEVRRREEPRLARHQAARRRPVARRLAPLPAGHAPVRQGHEHRRLRRVRRDRAGHRRPGARLRDGLDQQERRPDARWSRSATRSRSWCSRSTRTSAASASA